jgi:hypothetical protein
LVLVWCRCTVLPCCTSWLLLLLPPPPLACRCSKL